MAGRDEFTRHASEIPIDNSTIDCLDVAETVQEGFEEICTKASPRFTWGASGPIKNAYLLNDTVPSNLAGRISTVTGIIKVIFITTEDSTDEYILQIRRRDSGSFTTIASLSADWTDGQRTYIVTGLTIPVTTGDELSAYIEKSDNRGATNPVCGIILEGVTL